MCKILPQGVRTISTPGKPNSDIFFEHFSGLFGGLAKKELSTMVSIYYDAMVL